MIKTVSTAGVAFVAALAGWGSASAHAQQATDGFAAVQPGVGVLTARQETLFTRRDDPRSDGFGSLNVWEFETTLTYGLSPTWAVILNVPLTYRDLGDGTPSPEAEGFGVEDISLLFQHRFYQEDVGPIETRRAVLLGGVEIPTFDDGFSSDSFDPLLGVAYSQIDGRHGFNASALWKFNTNAEDDFVIDFGDSRFDALSLDVSYLYRLAPDVYTADSVGSHYFQAQLLGQYETNGDHTLIVAPGWLYEGPRWAFEATVQLPVFQELDSRTELEFGISLGLRYLF